MNFVNRWDVLELQAVCPRSPSLLVLATNFLPSAVFPRRCSLLKDWITLNIPSVSSLPRLVSPLADIFPSDARQQRDRHDPCAGRLWSHQHDVARQCCRLPRGSLRELWSCPLERISLQRRCRPRLVRTGRCEVQGSRSDAASDGDTREEAQEVEEGSQLSWTREDP